MCTVDTNLQILQAECGCEQTRCGAGYSLPKLQFPFVMVSEARTIPRVAQHDRSEFFSSKLLPGRIGPRRRACRRQNHAGKEQRVGKVVDALNLHFDTRAGQRPDHNGDINDQDR